MGTKTNRKKCLIIVAAFLCSTSSSAKASFASRTSVNLDVILTTFSLGVGDTWTTKAPMPTARSMLSASAVDGKIYAIGGNGGKSAVEQYDPVTDTWTTKAPMPTARQWLSTSAVNGKIYAIGGTPYTFGPVHSTVEEYDPATDTWAERAPILTARNVLSTSVVDEKIYAIGGIVRATTGAESKSSAVEAYDPATDTWTTKAPMPTARGFLTTSVVNGKIYAIGGATAAGGTNLSTVEEYNPATDTWTTKAPMPTRRAVAGASVVNGIIYVIGGGSGGSISTVEAYDPATDTWTEKAPMPTARLMLSTSAVNGKIYAIGGALGAPWNGISTVEEYEPIFIPADFYRDGIVDIEDLLILIENLGQNGSLVDIAPLPFGDGIVDVLDLEILMSYWGQKVQDVRAHWALDETEGAVAYDSIGNNNGTLHGEPLWQPAGGTFAGALAFDGIDDYVSTDFVLDPAKGSFSVFAWIKGRAPGQVIISQADTTIETPVGQSTNPGSTWLGANLSDGRLMTGLMDTYFGPLESESIITDGQWHHVGLVYDLVGLCRYLYVDGSEVAKDADLIAGVGSDGGLYFGAGKDLDAASFWSGLIDDVRIYNRAVSP